MGTSLHQTGINGFGSNHRRSKAGLAKQSGMIFYNAKYVLNGASGITTSCLSANRVVYRLIFLGLQWTRGRSTSLVNWRLASAVGRFFVVERLGRCTHSGNTGGSTGGADTFQAADAKLA